MDDYKKYREEVYKYIQEEIVPKYPEIDSSSLHILPRVINKDSEVIFKINSNMENKEIKYLEKNIKSDLFEFCDKLDDVYCLRMVIVLSKF